MDIHRWTSVDTHAYTLNTKAEAAHHRQRHRQPQRNRQRRRPI